MLRPGCRFFAASTSGEVTSFPVLAKKNHCLVKSITARKAAIIKVPYTTDKVDEQLPVFANTSTQYQNLSQKTKHHLIYVEILQSRAYNQTNNGPIILKCLEKKCSLSSEIENTSCNDKIVKTWCCVWGVDFLFHTGWRLRFCWRTVNQLWEECKKSWQCCELSKNLIVKYFYRSEPHSACSLYLKRKLERQNSWNCPPNKYFTWKSEKIAKWSSI